MASNGKMSRIFSSCADQRVGADIRTPPAHTRKKQSQRYIVAANILCTCYTLHESMTYTLLCFQSPGSSYPIAAITTEEGPYIFALSIRPANEQDAITADGKNCHVCCKMCTTISCDTIIITYALAK